MIGYLNLQYTILNYPRRLNLNLKGWYIYFVQKFGWLIYQNNSYLAVNL